MSASPISAAPSFHDAASEEDALTQIYYWSHDDTATLTPEECLHRAKTIQDFTLYQCDNDLEFLMLDYRGQQKYISDNFSPLIVAGVKFLTAIRYSDEMYDTFRRIQKSMIGMLAEGVTHVEDMSIPVGEDRRVKIFEMLKTRFCEAARLELCPDLIDPALEISDDYRDALGWIVPNTSNHGPVFLNRESFFRRTGKMVNTTCHEMTHHIMTQWATMVIKGDIEVSEGMKQDAITILLPIQMDATMHPVIYNMYRNSAFEDIAFETGDTIEQGYRLIQKEMLSLDDCAVCETEFSRRIIQSLEFGAQPA